MKFSVSISAHFVWTICRFIRWAEWASSFNLPWRWRMVLDQYALWARCVLYPSFREGVRVAHMVGQVFNAALDMMMKYLPEAPAEVSAELADVDTQELKRRIEAGVKAELKEEAQWTPTNN